MVSREARLGGGSALEMLFREGAVMHGPFFVLRYAANDAGHPRWAFAVGKRIAPHAVERNRVRRLLRAAADRAEIDGAWDIVVVAKRAALEASVAELTESLRRVGGKLRKAGDS